MLVQFLLFSILCWLFYSQTFLTSNKERVDDDPDANPYDDLRHYAYEVWSLTNYCLTLKKLILQGDGNSGGSLSSLNSGTDDADLEFEYLHNFGPRYATIILIIQLTECNIENFRSFGILIFQFFHFQIWLLTGSRNLPTCTAGSPTLMSLRLVL